MSPRSETIRCARCGGLLPHTGALAGQCPYCLLQAGLVEVAENPPDTGLLEDESLAPPSRIGPYTIEALLGAGGMGRVHRAVDMRLGRKVAIKFLSRAVADAA